MEQLELINLSKIPKALNKYKGHPGKMCSECKDIFSVNHPYGRKFYCRKQVAKNMVGHHEINKYSPSCFMFRQGDQNIKLYFRSGFHKLTEKSVGVPRLIPRRWKNSLKK